MDTTTITIGSLFALITITITVAAYIAKSKREIQLRASNYAVLQAQVLHLELSNEELKVDLKALEKELREEVKRLDKEIIFKIDGLRVQIDDLKDLIIKTLKK